jgi:hypothetical protein
MKGGTPFQLIAAGLLAIGGGLSILYAGFLPIPPFSDVPIPLVWQVIGLAGLAAALGVFLGRAWGRALGVGVTAIDLGLLLFRVIARGSGSSPLDAFVDVALTGGLDVFVLWVLLRRWQPRP